MDWEAYDRDMIALEDYERTSEYIGYEEEKDC